MNLNSMRLIGQNLFKYVKLMGPNFLSVKLITDVQGKSSNEIYLMNKLKERITGVTKVDVVDISHGCGDMYKVYVSSSEFKDKSLVQQHRLIQQALKEDVKNWHGLTIETEVV